MTRVYRLAPGDGPELEQPFRPSASTNHWNSGDVSVAYAAENVALCALEILCQWMDHPDLSVYRLFALDLHPEDVLDVAETHPDLDVEDRERTRAIGDAWAREKRSLAMRVPSAVVPFSDNFLINPAHPRFDPSKVLSLGPFDYDERVLRMVRAAQDEPPRKGPSAARTG